MPDLSQELYWRCHATLLKCDEFNSDASLRAVFVTAELKPYQDQLPEAKSKEDRVSLVIDHLWLKYLSDGRSVFPLFLTSLRYKRPRTDTLHRELDLLRSEIIQELSSIETVDVARGEAASILMARHGGQDFFRTWSLKDILKYINKMMLVLQVAIGGLATSALLVAG